jgi:formamidopyrimidine-DNA glycosylase
MRPEPAGKAGRRSGSARRKESTLPEYPDITVYIERLQHLLKGQPLLAIRILHPFLLRTATPPIGSIEGQELLDVERLGKRTVFHFQNELFLVLHLMISGRLHWSGSKRKGGGKVRATLEFPNGTMTITEASTKTQASLHLVSGRGQLQAFDRGGLEVTGATLEQFRTALRAENHTLKRALTDPNILSGIGNAYSDEILHRARLSPFLQTGSMTDGDAERLYIATREILDEWTRRLREEVGDGFPEKVTAFREEMAVHGRYGKPCPVCGTPVQRIRYATNETNYCPQCQTGGRLLADRALSRLLKQDWPRSLEEMEERKKRKAESTAT